MGWLSAVKPTRPFFKCWTFFFSESIPFIQTTCLTSSILSVLLFTLNTFKNYYWPILREKKLRGLLTSLCNFVHPFLFELNSVIKKTGVGNLFLHIFSNFFFIKYWPVHPKGNQSWIFIGRNDAEAETPILWPPDAKDWLIGKDPDAGRD